MSPVETLLKSRSRQEVGGQESFLPVCHTLRPREREWLGGRGTSFVRVGGVGTLGLAEGSSNVQSPEQEEGWGGACCAG